MFRITTGCAALLCAACIVLSPPMRAQGTAAAAAGGNSLAENPFVEKLLHEGTEGEQSALLARFEEWQQQPVPLATAPLSALYALPFLTRTEARRIRRLARDAGAGPNPAATWRRIDSVLSGDPDRIELLHRCTLLRPAPAADHGYTIALRSRLQQEDQPRAGFLDGRYPGSRLRLQQRFRLAVGARFEAAVLTEKDPGETSIADHVAGFAAVKDLGPIRRMVLGDFAITAGQGLVFWQAFGLAKGGEAVRVSRTPDLLSPYSSATEGFGARGAAVHLGAEALDAVIFYSLRKRDASIDAATGTAGAFSIDGLHRSESEQARRGSVDERMFGGHITGRIQAAGGILELGLSGQAARYTVPSDPRTPFGFRGDAAWALGANAGWTGERVSLFGEAALAHTQVPAFIAGLEAELTSRVSAAIILRRYHERFVSLQGAAFGERDGVQNEEGAYFGLRLRPSPRLKISLWADVYRFPNRTYFVHVPSSGTEGMCSAEYQLTPGTVLRLRAAHVRKDQTVASVDDLGRDIRPVDRRIQSSLRIEIQQEARNGTRMRLRAEYAATAQEISPAAGNGLLLSVDLRVKPVSALSLLGRLTAYGTDSYDARLYQFEHDVRGVMQNVVMYGDGLRCYLLAQWTPLPGVNLGLRYALTVQDGARSMSSGADEIAGDRIGKVSLQLDAEW